MDILVIYVFKVTKCADFITKPIKIIVKDALFIVCLTIINNTSPQPSSEEHSAVYVAIASIP